METTKARGVFFVLDRSGQVVSIRGYTPELRLIEFKDIRPVGPLRGRNFSDVAASFGYADGEEFALMLRRRGMNVNALEPQKKSGLSRLIGGLARS
jgi:hypothetical protein